MWITSSYCGYLFWLNFGNYKLLNLKGFYRFDWINFQMFTNKFIYLSVWKVMRKYCFIFLLGLGSLSGYGQRAEIIKLPALQEIIQSDSDQVKVINFWATWCAPCVKELPLFQQLHETRKDVKVTLVSMDLDLDPNPEKVYKFIARKKISAEVVILDEQNPNAWIDKIEKQWSGALPATIVINTTTGKKKFVERELHEGELEKLILEVQ